MPRTKERRLLTAFTFNSTSSGTLFDFPTSFTCHFALVSQDEIGTMIKKWGVKFKYNQKESQSSDESLNLFIVNHNYRILVILSISSLRLWGV
jgi:hypothetical protein